MHHGIYDNIERKIISERINIVASGNHGGFR